MRILRLIPAIGLFALSGCGGGGGGSNSGERGRAVFTVNWPARSRLIPYASESIKVAIGRGGNSIATEVIPRPAGGGTSTAAFENLPVGELSAKATAHPGTDGSGTAQASGTAPLIISAGQTTDFGITMGTTIVFLEISRPAGTIRPGDVAQLSPVPRDAEGNLVLVSPATLEWHSANQAVAIVNGSGVLTAGTNGSALITLTEWESERVADLMVEVEGGRQIAYESFSYPLASALAGQSGGTGWQSAWGGAGGTIDQGLFYLRLRALNNSAQATTGATTRTIWETLGNPGTTRFISFLLRPAAAPVFDSYFGIEIGGMTIGKKGGAAYYGAGDSASGVAPQQNTTAFLIVKAEFTAGNDRIDLWVNPTPGQPLPANPSAVNQSIDLGTFSTMSLTANLEARFDEIRIGETYGDVAPIVQIF